MLKKPRFTGGVHPDATKNTANLPVVVLEDFSKVQIPLSMHTGVPCTPIVKVGDEVAIGQKIADSDAFLSVPIHGSISGKVTAIKKIISNTGSPVDAIEIESDGTDKIHDSVQPPEIDSKESFIKAIRESGLVGLGGAAFPTHVKLVPPKGKEPEVLVVNGAECEPSLTSDYRNMIEHTDEIVKGIEAVLKWMDIPEAVIGVEDDTKDAALKLQSEIVKSAYNGRIRVKLLKTIYPQGAEKPLIYMTTGRKVPAGGLPHDVKVMVLNVTTVLFIAQYLETGMPLVRRNLTVNGGAVANPSNVSAPIGAFIRDIVEKIGGFKKTPSKILMGGTMMGVAIDRQNVGIIKANNAILLLDEEEAATPQEYPCIRCSKCLDVCPMNLMPTNIDIASRNSDIEGLEKFHAMDCMECGCCSFICPSKRFLVQSIRNGKQLLRKSQIRD